ncbi:hypothetical protein FDH97_gp261 [Erwinia phage vB_EamM_Deimos-Minion]|uniref:Uncharacterized protein n=1 Tax=Erwinia phage vB_EamM_Deimos-Minion TaxID=1815986 RepID=A0A173GFD2_9CAUD|nr:hypothetical protein FDH97_gp261 [Erwinia phage vB_EamM_Deimos-Minion]ANH52360.1 hypothetical protein DM_261 [Erwinia phage vB_EamM_Deimos-Minion]
MTDPHPILAAAIGEPQDDDCWDFPGETVVGHGDLMYTNIHKPQALWNGVIRSLRKRFLTEPSINQKDTCMTEQYKPLPDTGYQSPFCEPDVLNTNDRIYPRKSLVALLEKFPSDNFRGTPAVRYPFMRRLAVLFKIAFLQTSLDQKALSLNTRQTGKPRITHHSLTGICNLMHQLHYELRELQYQNPNPIDLTRYLKLLTGKDVWEKPSVGAWASEFTELYFHRHQAGVGKSMFYNMLPKIKLHLAGIHATFGGRPWIYESNCRGPAGFWPATIEYGMAHNGPAITAQLNRERLVKPKKGKA